MSYVFRLTDESVEDGFRRIARRELKGALALLRPTDGVESHYETGEGQEEEEPELAASSLAEGNALEAPGATRDIVLRQSPTPEAGHAPPPNGGENPFAHAAEATPRLPTAQAIHGLRKHIKKLRGLLQLVKPTFPRFAEVNGILREHAALLAPLRDAEVRLATVQALSEDLPPGLVEALEHRLDEEVARLRADPELPKTLSAMSDTFARLRDEAKDWRLSADGWKALEPGLKATWRKGRAGLAASQEALGRDAKVFHEWRKAVKHHWYQARLLVPIWPEIMSPWVSVADRLGETLGRHQDLDILRIHLALLEEEGSFSSAEHGHYLRAINARMLSEAEAALTLGARFYADKPKALARRWKRWWGAWQARQ